MEKIAIIFGTRPEFIKILPLIYEIRTRDLKDKFIFVFTNQHKDITKELFIPTNFIPDFELEYKDQLNSISGSFSHIFYGLSSLLEKIKKDIDVKMILAQGDTTTVACAAQYSYMNNIPFGHIEAGLRTFSNTPFPEEYYRKIISLSTTMHFAPTQTAKENLLKEGINENSILVTGNTIVDAVRLIENISKTDETILPGYINPSCLNVLITFHRRENKYRLVQLLKTI